MRATVMYGAGDVRVENVPDARLVDVLEGRIQPGRVFDWAGRLEDVPDGYRAMNEREVIKVMIEF